MKRTKYTYYLLALICMAASSCTSDDIISRGTESKTQISLTMKLSETRVGGNASGTYDYAEERYISDVSVYIFNKADKFIEKPENLQIGGIDGDAVRVITGELRADYTPYTDGIDIVVFINSAQRGIMEPTLSGGQSKSELYKQLVYEYAPGHDWTFPETPKQYMPMWGTGSIDAAIQPGINPGGSISLYRAIARVDVIFNEGEGFDHFTPSSVRMTYYNNLGLCATDNLDIPNIPSGNNIRKTMAEFQSDETNATYRLYIPEYNNKGADDSEISKIELRGELSTNGSSVAKTYTLEFQKDGSDWQDILRNHLYRFKITSINNEVTVTSSLTYEVEDWQDIPVTIPPFN